MCPARRNVLSVHVPEGINQAITRDIYGLPLSITQSGLYQNAGRVAHAPISI